MKTEKIVAHIDNHELERFDELFLIPVILFNDNGILYINDSCRKMLGYQADELPNPKLSDIVEGIGTNCVSSHFAASNHIAGSSGKHEITMLDKSGNKLYVEIIGQIVECQSEKCILATLTDITDKRKIQRDLQRVSKARALMLEVTQSILKSEDVNEMFQLILNNALKSIERSCLGTILVKNASHYTVASSIGYSDDIKDFALPYEDAFIFWLTKGKMDRIVNIPDVLALDRYHPVRTVFGNETYIKSTISAPIYLNGSLYGLINIDSVETNAFDDDDVKTMEFLCSNIEIALSNHMKYREKAFMARYDRLSCLYNRFYFEEQFEIIKKRALRYHEEFNIVMFDIDKLKLINDTYGHLTGDMVIRKIAGIIEHDSRKSDMIARLGGDEFIGIFFKSSPEQLSEKCRALLDTLYKDPLIVSGSQIICSFSYGIAHFPHEGSELTDLIRVADERMYSHKKASDFNILS